MAAPPVVLEDTSEGVPRWAQLCGFGGVVAGGIYLASRDWLLLLHGIGWLFAAIGILVILYSARAVVRARSSVSWPSVQGVVTRSAVVTSTSSNGGSTGGTITTYHPEVSYEYEVAGQRYRSHRIIFVNVNYTHDDATATAGRYPVGSLVTAYCDPRSPKVAVLEPGMARNASHYRLAFIVGFGFLLFGALLAFV